MGTASWYWCSMFVLVVCCHKSSCYFSMDLTSICGNYCSGVGDPLIILPIRLLDLNVDKICNPVKDISSIQDWNSCSMWVPC
jgi:hypothetical protein